MDTVRDMLIMIMASKMTITIKMMIRMMTSKLRKCCVTLNPGDSFDGPKERCTYLWLS